MNAPEHEAVAMQSAARMTDAMQVQGNSLRPEALPGDCGCNKPRATSVYDTADRGELFGPDYGRNRGID